MSEVYIMSEHVSWRKLDAGRSIMLDLRSGSYYTLNETATLVWDYLTHSMSSQDVVQQLARISGADAAEIERDVLGMVNSLVEKGFLIETDVSPEMPEATRITVPDIPYAKPVVEEHEAVTEITAGTDEYSSCSSGSHYWYPN